ncbi:uncharacterized protein N7487_009246 [Penicillium crustosum]|uniref:uncharacterized protein n=1 Tax=Penicillium crustosum TaxID=36656 RepID=UPI0023A05738|nr:uncharacterized protein N7487_009246 [Penicillium crustosum]KAJ5394943.1 hypothetical protein N7487_009246 [Penicillium crustosum]
MEASNKNPLKIYENQVRYGSKATWVERRRHVTSTFIGPIKCIVASSFSLIERVILSAGAMLIFSVYFHLTICPEGRNKSAFGSL